MHSAAFFLPFAAVGAALVRSVGPAELALPCPGCTPVSSSTWIAGVGPPTVVGVAGGLVLPFCEALGALLEDLRDQEQRCALSSAVVVAAIESQDRTSLEIVPWRPLLTGHETQKPAKFKKTCEPT